MHRYAFIDVANTKGSAGLLNFQIDPQCLYDYLCNEKWSCEQVFWYAGRIQNERNEKVRDKIAQIGYTIRDKDTHFFEKHYIFQEKCPKCQRESEFHVRKRKMPKANCDVELTVDALELAGPESEILIFTGDGDFRYLIEKLIEKGSRVRLFSTNKQAEFGNYRLSTRLKALLALYEETGQAIFTELNNLKHRIGKAEI